MRIALDSLGSRRTLYLPESPSFAALYRLMLLEPLQGEPGVVRVTRSGS